MANKSMYTKKLGREVARRAREVTGTYFVIPGMEKNKWMVVRHGRLRASRVFIDKEAAVGFAKMLAASKQGEVLIQGRDGRTAERISF